MSDEKERITALEERLEAHLALSKEGHDRNDADHKMIVEKLDEALLFQHKLKWTGRIILLFIGSVIGFLIHHAANIWEMLPMHGHTH